MAEVACVLECGEGTSNGGQNAHDNSDEKDDGMTNIDEEIDLEVERRIKRVLYINLLKQIYKEGNPVIDLLDEQSGRLFDYYVLYGTPKRRKIVPCTEKYGLTPEIVPSSTDGEEP
ncbi:hypothetical protein Adt_06228 [Abeliophyllum distichum]|uniref:Uncharacterized protein n=1 Tax=Abeliophyllum distichum TaxID=126358 RepID=A0ABD1V6C0_9LAMI